jgi:hypothetical protein
VNGPDNFEAASFDGNDDKFSLSDRFDIPDGEPWSIFTIAKPVDGFNRVPVVSQGNEPTLRYVTDTNKIEFLENDFDTVGVNIRPIGGEFNTLVFSCDGATFNVFLNGEFEGSTPSISTTKLRINHIGARADSGVFGNIDMATIGVWNREFNDAEIEYLDRLTEPRRAQL